MIWKIGKEIIYNAAKDTDEFYPAILGIERCSILYMGERNSAAVFRYQAPDVSFPFQGTRLDAKGNPASQWTIWLSESERLITNSKGPGFFEIKGKIFMENIRAALTSFPTWPPEYGRNDAPAGLVVFE